MPPVSNDPARVEEAATEQAWRSALAQGATPLPNRVIGEWQRRQPPQAADA